MGILDTKSNSKTTNNANSNGFSDVEGSNTNLLQGITVSGKNASSNITMTDNGAIASAFDFASKSSSNAYDFSRDLATNATAQVADAISAVSESARSETENIFINLQKYALYGAIIWGVVQIFRGRQ